MTFNNVDINSLTKSYDAYDNPILVDAQGNTYTPTYGGEMNTLQSLSKVSDMNGVPLTQYFDANGNFIYGNENKNYGTGKNGIARDYDINGNMTERAFVNDPWGDIKEAAILLGGSALGANALGALFGAEAGSLFGGAAGAGTTGLTAAEAGTTGLTAAEAGTAGLGGLTNSQIASLIKAGVGLLGAGGAASAGGGGAASAGGGGGGSNVPFVAPTQQVPQNNPAYYNQLQQYYNAYLPQSPRDVVTPLQQWYNSSYGA